MTHKYVYKNRKNGEIVKTNELLDEKDFELKMTLRTGQITKYLHK